MNTQHGIRNPELAAAAWAFGAVLAFMPVAASPQVVNDPTRPPDGFAAGDPGAAGDAGGGLVLQSVMISPSRKAAIINGEMVRLGEKYGDAVLIKVTENEVVLKSGNATQVLKMYPGVENKIIAPASTKRPPRRGADPAATRGASPH